MQCNPTTLLVVGLAFIFCSCILILVGHNAREFSYLSHSTRVSYSQVDAANILSIPVIATEQYPKGIIKYNNTVFIIYSYNNYIL